MENFKENIIPDTYTIRQALTRLNKISIQGNVLFIINDLGQMKGTITDGDIRRGLLKDLNVESLCIEAANRNFSFIADDSKDYTKSINIFISNGLKFIPLLDKHKKLIKIIDAGSHKACLPIDVFIMAGGIGARLMPLTKDCPKPMLKIGEKPIIEHNIDRLISYGVNNFTISINYLGHIIENHFAEGSQKGVKISYVQEKEPLGTIGSISLAQKFENEYVLVMNSDLLTDIDFLDFFETFKTSNADLSVATTPYHVDIPYAVLEMDENNRIKGLKEKPKYTYYSNAGIYLIKKQVLSLVPFNQFYNATDLIEDIIKNSGHVNSFPILSYWLDIGKMPDYLKAQEDIKHLRL
jgi:dTDP-glucose pyrophosphorylase